MNTPQIRLCIGSRSGAPAFTVCTHEGGKGLGTLQSLATDELAPLAKWIGQHGGVAMLDAFEVALINAGQIRVWPMTKDGDPLKHEHEALEIWRDKQGACILWQRLEHCSTCDGAGHFAPLGEPIEFDDTCAACGGQMSIATEEILTDMDGLYVPNQAYA